MTSPTQLLKDTLQHILNQKYSIQGIDLVIQETRKEFEGSHTFTVFQAAKLAGKSPEIMGQELGEWLKLQLPIEKFNVVKGFLNITFTDTYWLEFMGFLSQNEAFGTFPPLGEKAMVEYSSPNTNKPLHLGHLRNNFLGFAIANILEANGYQVIKANLVNDRGIHICKSMLAYQKFGNGELPHTAPEFLKGDHLVGKYYVAFDKAYKSEVKDLIANGMTEEEANKKAPLLQEAQSMLQRWENGDNEVVGLWEKMNGWVYEGFEQTYKRMGVSFNTTYYESNTYLLGKELVEEGKKRNVFFEKEDHSVWIDLTDIGLDEKLVLRGDGTSVYITQDLGTADLKFEDFGATKSIYVVGNEQDYHFKVLFEILKRLQRPYAQGLYHLSYGMVELPSGRMKSREGTVVDADDLMAEMVQTAQRQAETLGKIEGMDENELVELYETIGLGALKYFLLKVDPKKKMMFNPEESIELQGHTGPFIQYTHARIKALERKAAEKGISFSSQTQPSGSLHDGEKNLLVVLEKYPSVVKEAGETYSPALIANYIYELAKAFNRFYTDVSVFNAENPIDVAFRLHVSHVTAKTIAKGMGLLGIRVPERM